MTEHARSCAASSRAANCSKNCSSVSSCAGKLPLLLSWVSMKYFMVSSVRTCNLHHVVYIHYVRQLALQDGLMSTCAPLLFGQFCEKGSYVARMRSSRSAMMTGHLRPPSFCRIVL